MGKGRPAKCPHCSVAGRSIKKGYRYTKTIGKRSIRQCKACGRKYTPKYQKPSEALKDVPAENPSELNPSELTVGLGADPEPPKETIRMLPLPDVEWTSSPSRID